MGRGRGRAETSTIAQERTTPGLPFRGGIVSRNGVERDPGGVMSMDAMTRCDARERGG